MASEVLRGEAFVYPDGSVDAPTYAWKKIQPED